MLLLIIFIIALMLLPVAIVFFQIAQQKKDFRKFAKKQETYNQFCERYYSKYIL